MAMVILTITGGEVIPEIEIPITATILDLKERIQMFLDVTKARQTLTFNGEVLMNDQIIGHFNFEPFATLVLDVTPLPGQPKFYILVLFNSEVIDIRVKETYSVVELKEKLGRRCAIVSETITLHRLGMEMEDDLPLSAYYVCEYCEVKMTVKFEPR